MSHNNNSNKNKKSNNIKKFGVDTLLTTAGKQIGPGQEVRFVLVKGPGPTGIIATNNHQNTGQPDPVNPKAPYEQFPLVAKFPESVVTPNVQTPPWNTARLYQQDTPKIQDDSDEEVTEKDKPRKRWRSKRNVVPKRQWILQNEVEFLKSMMAKRQKRKNPQQQEQEDQDEALSTRYEGVPEHNPSQYILLEQQQQQSLGNSSSKNIQVTMLPTPHATVTFSQPKARKTLSMTEAENAIADQRGTMTRFMMHDKKALLQGKTSSAGSDTRKRLLGRLQSKRTPGDPDEEEEEDVMGDIAFRNRKGGGRARKELLNTLGDSGIKVDVDGVLGGNNDSEFGRGQRFNRFNAEQKNNSDNNNNAAQGGEQIQAETTKGGSGGGAGDVVKGFEGAAMADDFYQRDVGAEYEELDYDANEQFDDDDVDVGETEVQTDGADGFAGAGDGDDDEDSLENSDAEGEGEAGPQGLANLAMFRVLLAKARGEITKEQAEEAVEAHEANSARRRSAQNRFNKQEDGLDPLAKILEAAAAKKKGDDAAAAVANNNNGDGMATNPANGAGAAAEEQQAAAAAAAAAASAATIFSQQVDENGLRIISLESVRREIWLNHGRLPTKRLMKIFGTKSNKQRQAKFREVVKELCTMENDPVDGKMFVLKQHYANMG